MTQTPDAEPFYVLQASDPFAAGMVRMLACFKNGDLAGALGEFNDLAQSEAMEEREAQPFEDMAGELLTVAETMDAFMGVPMEILGPQ